MSKKLSEMSLEELWQLFPIFLTEHQDYWKDWYAEEKTLLKSLLPQTAKLNHIGSTAINTIWAKPIIDIVIGVYNLIDIVPYIDVLKEKELIYRGNDVSNQILFVKGDFEKDIRTHHIHVVKWDGIEWNNYINFRDYLNAFPLKAKQYDNLKQGLANKFYNDRKQYTKGKQQLIDNFLIEARIWKGK